VVWALAVAVSCLSLGLGHFAGRADTGQWQRFEAQQKVTDPPGGDPYDAVCPIVYQVDDGVPGPRGYRYFFYGNGFFINRDGYVLTAAHVLSQLKGAQPFLLVRGKATPPHFVQADLVALDRNHDVAVLRATPNPFDNNDAVTFLPLAAKAAAPGDLVQATTLLPSHLHDSYSDDREMPQHGQGAVLRFEFSQLDRAPVDTELFLFNHAIISGESGGAVVSGSTHEVVGLVEGQWLRRDLSELAAKRDESDAGWSVSAGDNNVPVPGAVVPIHYALAMLQEWGIRWQTASGNARADVVTLAQPGATVAESRATALPEPLSLAPASFPKQAFGGGEVVLDALVGLKGTLSDVKVVRGEQPFLANALNAVHTWTFFPARAEGHSVAQRISIAFQFPQPYVPPRDATVHHYDEVVAGALVATQDQTPLPLMTVEPSYPPASVAGGSVILYEAIDRAGHAQSVQTLSGAEPLTAATLAATNEWQFAPAIKSGNTVESAAVVAVTFRRRLENTRTRTTP
jgi:outer membrane biosynthesis protein TonB